MDHETINITTDATGAGSGKTKNLLGKIAAIVFTKPASGGYSDGVSISIASVRSGITIFSKTLSTCASVTVFPRVALNDTAGAAIAYDGTHPLYDQIPVINDEVSITITSGGDTKSGTFEVILA